LAAGTDTTRNQYAAAIEWHGLGAHLARLETLTPNFCS